MSSSVPTPRELQNAQVEEAILDAIRESEYPDTSVREVAEEFPDRNYHTVRKHVRRLREDGRVEVTRTCGPAKLYRVVEDSE